ncbi:hypothetical protein A3D78_05105 [Candidatus Gottesmanbacteria bacterium RIFCSPHIGHO2_02_FULL_39_14]|uniref:Glycosyltransferase RgtA/B/C/D-like domain-containing protein n=1 Tax=Candidatus Gottesmanbacteria bacterium RIFCSPHIGHO2_02_FULL_39_14 TaxID=1798383 RepID=A0A1F5ZZ14_9BACT|nr:MAG: hypothetical protein A3D78_05105 [Candidatus Gottesmanbacteria bacterium RIFCSPHIGHO2_02_FULL_39_14]
MKKSFIYYFFFANFLFLLSNLPLFYFIFRSLPNTVFTLNHSITDFDYNVYLSVITQGSYGDWLMKDAFTTESTNPTLFYFFYIILGKMAALFQIPAYIMYHLGRFLSAELFLISVFLLNIFFLGRRTGVVSSYLTLLSTIAPFSFFGEEKAFIDYIPWWANFTALKRLDALPHYLAGYSLLVISIILIFLYRKSGQKKYLIFSLMAVFPAGIIFPPSLLPLLIALPLSFVFCSLINFLKQREKIARDIPVLILVITVSLISLLLIWRENQNGFPWDLWNKWEIGMWNLSQHNFNMSLFLVFGLMPIFSLPAFFWSFKTGKLRYLFISFWAYLPYFLLPMVDFLGISKMRLVTTASFIPQAMLAAITFFKIGDYFKKPFLTRLLIIFFLLTTLPVNVEMFIKTLVYYQKYPKYLNIFIPDEGWQAIKFVKENIAQNSVILSNWFTGNVLPAHAPVISFTGHHVHTKDFFEKNRQTELFYDSKMTESQAKEFLSNNKIQYVFFGLGEMKTYSQTLSYSFLKEIYNKDFYRIYQLQ